MTIVICLFIVQAKNKNKQKKRNIKSRKIFKSKCTIIKVWLKRQRFQQALIRPTSIEEVEKTNATMANLQ